MNDKKVEVWKDQFEPVSYEKAKIATWDELGIRFVLVDLEELPEDVAGR